MPDKLTDSEIVKALECCSVQGHFVCDECPAFVNSKCTGTHKAVLDLINRLQAENERLQLLFESVINSRDGYIKVIEQYKAENERLKLELADTKRDLRVVLDNSISAKLPHCVLCGKGAILTRSLKEYDELIGDISTEAYKEFAERLKENACEDYEIYEKCAKNMLSFDYQQGYADYNDRLIWYIDNILKELVGDTNA